MAVVERFKQESMYGLSAKKKIAVVESWPLVEVRLYHGCNPFQSSSTSSIPPSFFCICCVFYAPFSCSEQFRFIYATQLVSGYHSFNYDNFRDTASLI